MNDLISIIIPAYNVAEYIAQTLQSVLASTYTNIELICVNDGSTDDTASVLDKYAKQDNRVHVIHKENGGVTSARLCGIEEAKGDWIGFIDGDDVIDADMYERLMVNVTSEDIDISHCGYKKIFPNGEIEYYYNSEKKLYQNVTQGCKDLLEGSFVEPGLVNKLYRKKLFEGLRDWLDCSIKINEDLLMNFYLFRKARKSVYEDFCPYHYIVRVGSASASKVNEHKLYDPIRVMDILAEETKADNDLKGIVKSRVAYLLIRGTAQEYGTDKKLVKEFRKYTVKRLRKILKNILQGECYSKKRKLCALWVCMWPASYRWIHRMHVKRKYKKYKEIYPWL